MIFCMRGATSFKHARLFMTN